MDENIFNSNDAYFLLIFILIILFSDNDTLFLGDENL